MGYGTGSRALSLLLACLFATGFLPSAGPGCDCTAGRNCGCTCWLGRGTPETDDAPSELKPLCCAREARDGEAPVASCAARALPNDGKPEPSDGSATSHDRQFLDWELTDTPAQLARDAARDVVRLATPAHDALPLEPPTPPPRSTPSA
jgi:hypothetical protein